MFCMNCGKPLAEGARFCGFCGTSINSNPYPTTNPRVNNINLGTKFVPGNCTNCGAALQVNPSLQAAICPACGTPFIVQQAVNNFNVHSTGNISVQNAVISMSGVNAESYVKRAIGLEQQYDYIKALEFYNKALDADPCNQAALTSVARINRLIDDYCFKVRTVYSFLSSGELMLKKDRLEYITNNGKVTTYDLSLMTDIITSGGYMKFVYSGDKNRPVSFDCGMNASDWVAAVVKAKNGDYPKIFLEDLMDQSNYQTYFNDFNSFLSKKSIK